MTDETKIDTLNTILGLREIVENHITQERVFQAQGFHRYPEELLASNSNMTIRLLEAQDKLIGNMIETIQQWEEKNVELRRLVDQLTGGNDE